MQQRRRAEIEVHNSKEFAYDHTLTLTVQVTVGSVPSLRAFRILRFL